MGNSPRKPPSSSAEEEEEITASSWVELHAEIDNDVDNDDEDDGDGHAVSMIQSPQPMLDPDSLSPETPAMAVATTTSPESESESESHPLESSLLLPVPNADHFYQRILLRQACHLHLAQLYSRLDAILRCITIICTAFVSSSLFAGVGAPSSSGTDSHSASASSERMIKVLSVTCTIVQLISFKVQLRKQNMRHKLAYRECSRLKFQLEDMFGDVDGTNGKMKIREEIKNHKNFNRWVEVYEDYIRDAPTILPPFFTIQRAFNLNSIRQEAKHKMMMMMI